MTTSLLQMYLLTIIVALLAVIALAAAVALQVTGNDASKAWDAFGGFAVFFAGVHVPSPLSN